MKTNDELQRDIIEEIKWDPQLQDVHTQVGVAVHDGVVTLTGAVDTYSKKLAAEKAAQRVHGTKVVACDIEVKFGALQTRTDTQIAEAVKDALRWNSAVNEEKVKVRVDDGWVYLEGIVDWDYQKTFVQNNVEGLLGVKGITNTIKINASAKPVDTKEIKKKITAAFHRSAAIDSSAIQIDAVGNKITLKGKVKSWAEIAEAQRIAWSSPGVLTVDNQLEIDTETLV